MLYSFSQETANHSRNFTRRDVNLLKIILCSGLYPQVAIADDCNTFKSSSEQAFHTKVQNLVRSYDFFLLSFPWRSMKIRPHFDVWSGFMDACICIETFITKVQNLVMSYDFFLSSFFEKVWK